MSLTFQCNYFEGLSALEGKLSNLALVCEQLTSSKELQKLLALVLTYGNYMNGGNWERGQADGFTLDILPKLKETKANENNFTFLHFIVMKYIELEGILTKAENPEDVKLPVPEPSDIEKASCSNFDDIEKEMRGFNTELESEIFMHYQKTTFTFLSFTQTQTFPFWTISRMRETNANRH